MRADTREPVPRDRAESQRAVVVADHDDTCPRAIRQPGRGLIEDQPVAGVDRVQVRRLDIGEAPEVGEHVGLVMPSHRIHAPRLTGQTHRRGFGTSAPTGAAVGRRNVDDMGATVKTVQGVLRGSVADGVHAFLGSPVRGTALRCEPASTAAARRAVERRARRHGTGPRAPAGRPPATGGPREGAGEDWRDVSGAFAASIAPHRRRTA